MPIAALGRCVRSATDDRFVSVIFPDSTSRVVPARRLVAETACIIDDVG